MDNIKQKILIVDDDTFLLNMYSLKFSNEGFEVVTCQNTPDALKKLSEGFSPSLLLLDVVMPGMDGLELLQEIRNKNFAQNATVVMLTNQSDSADIEKAKALKADGYIVKATTIPSEVINEVKRIHEAVKKS